MGYLYDLVCVRRVRDCVDGKPGIQVPSVGRCYSTRRHNARTVRHAVSPVNQLHRLSGTIVAPEPLRSIAWEQGCSGARTRGDGVPHFFRQGGRVPHPPLFGLKFVQKLVRCCNWLRTETQCKIISVQRVYRPKLF